MLIQKMRDENAQSREWDSTGGGDKGKQRSLFADRQSDRGLQVDKTVLSRNTEQHLGYSGKRNVTHRPKKSPRHVLAQELSQEARENEVHTAGTPFLTNSD